MARKDLLKGLMDTPAQDQGDETTSNPSARPRYTKGAIGAVSRSIAELKSRSVSDIDPFLIDAGGVKDRLSFDQGEHETLMASLKKYGQQVPVLVRPHPGDADRYQIVYGRRRVMALRDLGLPIKAMVRDLDDTALIMAQGQENNARKDLSFIEKANFARQMQNGDYPRTAMCDALHIDKTVISRMLSVVERIPVEVIEAIGAASNVGRDRWVALADAYAASKFDAGEAVAMIHLLGDKNSSDKRFEALLTAVMGQGAKAKQTVKTPPATRTPLKTSAGLQIGEASWNRGKMTLTMNNKVTDGFDEWLVENIAEIHQNWKTGNGE